MHLPSLLDSARFVSLTVHRTLDGFQVNLNVDGGNSWRIREAATASEALEAVLNIDRVLPPPPPY